MSSTLPKVIWTLWLQGWDRAPDIVRTCRKSWETHNPDWTIRALSGAELSQYLDASLLSALVAGKDLPPEAFSDLVRILLLERYGGIWIDGTVYCLRALDTWLPGLLGSGFFAFSRPTPDRLVASWFLAASKGNYTVQEWRRRAVAYWSGRSARHDYFWFHGLFAEAYAADPDFRASWDATPRVSAGKPHCFAPYEKLSAPLAARELQVLDSPPTPLLKLTHKLPLPECGSDSLLNYLRTSSEAAWLRAGALARERPRAAGRRLLVAWYGSFAGHGTIGDLLAMQSAVTQLVALGHAVCHATAAEIEVPGSRRVDWRTTPRDEVDALLFVCGPILKGHPQTEALFEEFAAVRKIGVGVSLFPPGHDDYLDPFDEVLAREGAPEPCEDIAILAPASIDRRRRPHGGPPTVGIVLRGQQSEYGEARCLCERTERMACEAAESIVRQAGGSIVRIENHLQRSGLSQAALETQYADCDLIITSRFHGAMLAIRHFVPAIAIDQIAGGAKVRNLVGAGGWPYVHEAGTCDVDRLVDDARKLLAGEADRLLFDVRRRTLERANRTLARLGEIIARL